MTTLQIDSNDANAIEALLDIAKQKFNLNIKVLDKPQPKEPKGKWAKVADKMRGTLTQEDVEYIQKCSQEVRDGFEIREIKL